QRAAEDEQQRLATELAIENTLDTGLYPVTSAWDGARTVHLGPGGSTADAWLVTAEGGVIRIQTFADSPDTGRAELPCWLMHPVSGTLDETVTMDDYMGVCELLAEGSWRLVDGSAVALTFEGHLVMVSGSNVTDFSDRGGERTAIPEEIAAAAAHLRTASREELREARVVVAAAEREPRPLSAASESRAADHGAAASINRHPVGKMATWRSLRTSSSRCTSSGSQPSWVGFSTRSVPSAREPPVCCWRSCTVRGPCSSPGCSWSACSIRS